MERVRLRRLLRNRVSAQQARERKKSYVSNLENTNKDQAQRVSLMLMRSCVLANGGVFALDRPICYDFWRLLALYASLECRSVLLCSDITAVKCEVFFMCADCTAGAASTEAAERDHNAAANP